MENIGAEVIFDSKGADKKISNLGQGFANLQEKSSSVSAVSAKTLAIGQFMGTMLTRGFDKLMSGIDGAIPALSQTLGQAKTVLFNNLFKPLSDVLLPMLRNLMNWVRDNRAGFVQLGSVISGAFLFVVSVVKQVFGILSSIFNKFFSAFTGGAKASFKSVADVLNLVLLKIAFAVQFMLILIEPVIQAIADLFIWLFKSAIFPFFEGMLEGLSGLGDAYASLFESLAELGRTIGEIFGEVGGKTQWVADVFKFLGRVSGMVIKGMIMSVVLVIDLFVKLITSIIKAGAAIPGAFKAGFDWLRTAVNDVIDWFRAIPEKIVQGFKNAFDKLAGLIKNSYVAKVIMKLTGQTDNDETRQAMQSETAPPLTTAGGAAQSMSNSSSNINANTTVNFNGPVTNKEQARAGVAQAQGSSIQNLKAAQGR